MRAHVPSKRGEEIANSKGEAITHESTKVIDVILESSDCAWDGVKRWKSETGVSEGGRKSEFFCISGITKQMCTRKDIAEVLYSMDKLLDWETPFDQQKSSPTCF
jgi:hypothetical protein